MSELDEKIQKDLKQLRVVARSHRSNGWFDLARAVEESIHSRERSYPGNKFPGLPLPAPPGCAYDGTKQRSPQ
jgi:hypothetical protein